MSLIFQDTVFCFFKRAGHNLEKKKRDSKTVPSHSKLLFPPNLSPGRSPFLNHRHLFLLGLEERKSLLWCGVLQQHPVPPLRIICFAENTVQISSLDA